MSKLEQEPQTSEALLKRERDLRALTQAFRDSEARRQAVTEKVRVAKGGVPLPVLPKPKKVPDLKQLLSHVLADQSRGQVVEELKQFSLEINGLSDKSKNVDATLVSVNRRLQVLTDKLTVDLDERRKLRLKLSATIDDLDEYLKNWL